MTPEQIIGSFESYYDVVLTKDGIKKIYEHFSIFDEDIIIEAFSICTEQYDDAEEAFYKLGGICYNLSVQYIED